MKAISIRQPWAWLIVAGHKDIENRSWPTKHRGPVLIHAGQQFDPAHWEIAREAKLEFGIDIPDWRALATGAIVGIAEIVDCVEDSDSPWWDEETRYGFRIANAIELPEPISGRGQLSLFDVPFELDAEGVLQRVPKEPRDKPSPNRFIR